MVSALLALFHTLIIMLFHLESLSILSPVGASVLSHKRPLRPLERTSSTSLLVCGLRCLLHSVSLRLGSSNLRVLMSSALHQGWFLLDLFCPQWGHFNTMVVSCSGLPRASLLRRSLDCSIRLPPRVSERDPWLPGLYLPLLRLACCCIRSSFCCCRIWFSSHRHLRISRGLSSTCTDSTCPLPHISAC